MQAENHLRRTQWTLVLFRGDMGCREASALSDLIKEVNAIQACGDHMTTDGKCFRTKNVG